MEENKEFMAFVPLILFGISLFIFLLSIYFAMDELIIVTSLFATALYGHKIINNLF